MLQYCYKQQSEKDLNLLQNNLKHVEAVRHNSSWQHTSRDINLALFIIPFITLNSSNAAFAYWQHHHCILTSANTKLLKKFNQYICWRTMNIEILVHTIIINDYNNSSGNGKRCKKKIIITIKRRKLRRSRIQRH